MAWQEPVTTWGQNGQTIPGVDDFKRIEGNIAELKNSLIIHKTNISILSANWVDDTSTSGFWYYEINDADVDADSVVDVNIHLADLEKAEDVKSVTQSFAEKYRLYADAQPAENITVDVRITNQIGGGE